MHLLTTTSASLDDVAEPVDLRQQPADVVALSFTDSDLSALAAAWKSDGTLPSMRLANLRDLRHPMSVDLWADSVARHARVIVVRILGGHDWWRYGCDRLAAIARETGIKLALLPGESHDEDARLAAASTLPRAELDRLLGFFRQGGLENMRALARMLAAMASGTEVAAEAVPLPKAGFYERGPSLPAGGRKTPRPSPSSSTARCSWPPMSRRSTRCARPSPATASTPSRSSCPP